MAARTAKKMRVLIVGDWVVDEHWVTSVHRSTISSRRGKAHYRSLHAMNSAVESLCGAGRTASILYRTRSGRQRKDKAFEVYGIGAWNTKDSAIVAGMFEPQHQIAKNPFQIYRGSPNPPKKLHLYNVADLLAHPKSTVRSLRELETIRVIRVYQNTGSKVNLLHRIDWELPITTDALPLHKAFDPENAPALEDWSKSLPSEIDAVIVKDMCKGVVNESLVKWLRKRFRGAKWFISTKAWNPDWYSELKGCTRLLIIPPKPAQEAVRSGEISRWIMPSGVPSQGALRILDDLHKQLSDNENDLGLIVLPDESSILGRAGSEVPGGEIDAVIQPKGNLPAHAVGVPMASVFFAVAIAQILKKDQIGLKDLASNSLDFTSEWRSFEAERVRRPEKWDPTDEPQLQIPWSVKHKENLKVSSFCWRQCELEWDQALDSSRLGIISRDGEDLMEIWRTMMQIDGYVCCTDHKSEQISRLVKELSEFKDVPPERHLGGLLVAKPGAGKSYLISRIAKMLNMRWLSFNITQMTSRNDILECFDSIITNQSRFPEDSMLVFVDEINAKIEDQDVYDAFLVPLEEGIYVRAGKRFQISPCVWLFAGTRKPDAVSAKGEDFVSRLRLGVTELTTHPEEDLIHRLEQVYMGASLLLTTYPDVRTVSPKVLKAFYHLPKETEVRDLRHFTERFRDVQYGEVLSKNIPEEWLLEKLQPQEYQDWLKAPEGDHVRLEQ